MAEPRLTAVFRAIESGVTLVRQADIGLSIVVDPYGQMSTAMDLFNDEHPYVNR